MRPITVVIPYSPNPFFEKTLLSLTKSILVEEVFLVSQESIHLKIPKGHILVTEPLSSYETLHFILKRIRSNYLLLLPEVKRTLIDPHNLEKILEAADSKNAGLVYSDFYDETKNGKIHHPLNDYQLGSVRDDFDFGAVILFSIPAVRRSIKKYQLIPKIKFASLYDLRLKISIDHSLYHLKKPLYTVMGAGESFNKEKMFNYVDPRNQTVQKEMEIVFTDYLKKIGAYLPPPTKKIKKSRRSYPVEASIIIPVRDRKETISEAIKSALSQETDFSFNVIVVDNHSKDGTTSILSKLAGQSLKLKHLIPKRMDLGIGGCWNEALRYKECGRYVVQLDSDDLYSHPHSLQKMVDMLRQGEFGMVIGSYTLVNSEIEEIPPGLINHQEWTEENGHNNALRINGLGAPRGFVTDLIKKIGFPNVSYGEDYAVALRICREYRIGRIYENLYLCRRWSGNSDADLSLEVLNRNNAFKDRIRTNEILTRQRINQTPRSLRRKISNGYLFKK